MVPAALLVLAALTAPVRAEGDCYSGGSVTGAVLGTVLAIFLLQGLLYFLWNMYWKGKSGRCPILREYRWKWFRAASLEDHETMDYLNGKDLTQLYGYIRDAYHYRQLLVRRCPILREYRWKWFRAASLEDHETMDYLNGKDLTQLYGYIRDAYHYRQLLVSQHLVLVTDPEKGESIFAFDNPGFKEGPSILPNGDKENQNLKVKWTQWNSNAASSTPTAKGKSLDDTYVASPPLTKVPLRSHDFTGLGFNICGNMRDGIFVKDVLHRGPASESGRIMPGDRIDSIKINFRHMVFEDALTIMSYASPYEVEMSVESRNASNTSSLLRTPPPPHKISHPVYRSQSISDLHKICKPSLRRVGDQPSSLLSDTSGGELKYSTLDRKPKPIDPERTQNTRNCIIENVQKHENTFHEVDLSKVEVDEVDERKGTPSPSNVKSILVKGIQNLKEKLQNSFHEEPKEEIKGGVIVNVSAHNTLEKKKPVQNDGFQTVDLSVPNVPKEVEKAGISARNRRSTIEEDFDLSDGEDPVAAKRNKRKAPKPPPTPEDEETVNLHSLESMDSDSENGDKKSGTTIELNSSHITVHHVPESESRKASSLGDLSRYEAENVMLLERAVSLDLGDGAPGNKKRKAPMPPQESCPFKEARMDQSGTGTLKKSSVWGTLEDVIQNGSDSSDADLGISGCSTPEKSELITSTPFKFPTSILNDDNVNNVEISNYKWEMSLPDTTDFITALNGDDTPPELPTSPMPTMSTFITEIQVTSIKPTNENEVIHLDNTQQLFDHMNSHKLDLESINDEDSIVSPESPKSSPEPMIVDEVKKESVNINHEETPERNITQINNEDGHNNHVIDINRVNHEENGIHHDEVQVIQENHLNHSEKNVNNEESRVKIDKHNDEIKANHEPILIKEAPTPEEKPQKATSPGQRSEVTKPSRSGVTVTNIKTSPSRIPVRAGPRSPGTSTTRTVIQRNGHTSP